MAPKHRTTAGRTSLPGVTGVLLIALVSTTGCGLNHAERSKLASDVMLARCFDVSPYQRSQLNSKQDGISFRIEKNECQLKSGALDLDRFVMRLMAELRPAGFFQAFSRDWKGNGISFVNILLDDRGSRLWVESRPEGVTARFSYAGDENLAPRTYFEQRRIDPSLAMSFEKARRVAANEAMSAKRRADNNAANWDAIWADQAAKSAAAMDNFRSLSAAEQQQDLLLPAQSPGAPAGLGASGPVSPAGAMPGLTYRNPLEDFYFTVKEAPPAKEAPVEEPPVEETPPATDDDDKVPQPEFVCPPGPATCGVEI